MSISKGLRALARLPTGTGKSGRWLSLESSAGWPLRGEEDGSMDGALKIATAARCIEVLANSMAVLPVFMAREATHERVRDHYLLPLLTTRPNEAQSAVDLYRLLMLDELGAGNAYTWLDRRGGRIAQRVRLDPRCVEPYIDRETGRLWYIWTDPRTGRMTRLSPADVTHYKELSPDGIKGVAKTARAAVSLSTASAAQRYERSTWLNGGQPSGVLETDSVLDGKVSVARADGSSEQITKQELIRREWDKVHSGPDKAFRVAVLDRGLSYKPITMSPADTQYVEGAEVRAVDICRHFGVPPHLAFAGKQSYESNEQNGIDFVNYTLLGYETAWAQEDSYKLLSPRDREAGIEIHREMKVFLRGNVQSQAAWMRAMHDMGAYSVNDILGLDDRPPVAGGDLHLAPLDHVPLEDYRDLSRQRAAGGGKPNE